MKLPNASSAIVSEKKVTEYLLNAAHPAGGSKAKFFIRFGFKAAQWRQLSEALIKHACANDLAGMEEQAFGTRYVVDGLLIAPDGSSLNIRSVWYIDFGGNGNSRLVTAYPSSKL